MTTRARYGLIVAAIALLAAAPVQQVVVQAHRKFSVDVTEIVHGSTIRFQNADPFPHQLYAKGPGVDFDSDLQSPGEDVTLTFPVAGTVQVRCGVHPKMLLTVTVQ